MFRDRTYRPNAVRLGVATSAGAVLCLLALQLIEPSMFATAFNPIELVSVVGLMFALSFFIAAAFPTYAGADGLRSTDGIGRYYDVRWDSIRRVDVAIGFIWIQHGKPGTRLCIPTFLDSMDDFRAFVLEHAPAENLLALRLKK